MNHWMCESCHHVFQAASPPEACPGCGDTCTFVDVTCYIPECGGPGKLDRELVARKVREARRRTP